MAQQRFAKIDVSSSGDSTLVAAVSGKCIRVLTITFVAAGAVTITFKSGSSTSITGPMNYAANGGAVEPPFNNDPSFQPEPFAHFKTAAGEALVINLGSAVAVGGWLTYVLSDS